MNPPITTTIAHADPNASPITINDLIDILNPLLASVMGGSYIPYVIGNDTPGADDRNKAWIYTDTVHRPIELRLWHPASGHWRRLYNGMIGEIRGYYGNPGYNSNPSSDFDIDGHGQIGGRYDGWQICNGKNGAPDFSNRELCGANMNNATGTPSGYQNGWRTLIDGVAYHTGGQWTEVLLPENVPLPAKPAQIPIDRWTADGNTRSPGSGLYGAADASIDQYLLPADSGNPNPVGVFTGDPFFAAAWVIFQGY